MARLDANAEPRQLSGDVEEAPEIAGEQCFGAGRGDLGRLVRHHLVGNLGVFDAERAAEAAAHFRTRQLGEAQPLDRGEQRARLRLDPELAQPGTAVMIGRAALPARRHPGHAADIDEERDQLMGPRCQLLGHCPHRRLVGEQLGIMHMHHAGAGTRRRNDVIIPGKGRDDLPGDPFGVGPIARIIGRLAAAGLGARHLDRAAGRFQQGNRGKADTRSEQINEAGHQ